MRLILMGIAALALGACVSGAKPGAMAVAVSDATIISDDSPLRQAFTVGAVTGGKQTNPLWSSQVANEDFAEALRQSLAAHAMLADADGAYRLDAELKRLRQPIAGFDATVTSEVQYRVTDIASDSIIFNENVTEAYTAKFGDALIGFERLRLANEGSIKANVSTLMRLLIEKLGGAPVIAEPEEESVTEEPSS